MSRKRGEILRSKINIGGRKVKITLNKVFKTLNGKSMKDEDDKDLTLRTVVVNALLSQTPDDKIMKGIEKVKRYKLSIRVHDTKVCLEITVEQCALIKEQIAKIYTPLIAGQAWMMLDPASAKEDGESEETENKKKE